MDRGVLPWWLKQFRSCSFVHKKDMNLSITSFCHIAIYFFPYNDFHLVQGPRTTWDRLLQIKRQILCRYMWNIRANLRLTLVKIEVIQEAGKSCSIATYISLIEYERNGRFSIPEMFKLWSADHSEVRKDKIVCLSKSYGNSDRIARFLRERGSRVENIFSSTRTRRFF